MMIFLKEIFLRWWHLQVSQLSAAITYYTIFSLTPLLVIAIAIAGFFFGPRAAQTEILTQVENVLGERGIQFFERTIANSTTQQTNVLTPLIGLLMLSYGASGTFNALRNALNKIFGENDDGKHPLVGYVRGRILALVMVLIIGGLLLLSLLITALMTYLARFIQPTFALSARVLNEGIAFVVVTVMLAFVYKFLPDNRPPWRYVFQGALVGSAFYNLGKFGIGYYLSTSNIASIYDTAGTVMLLLLWIYYSVQIMLIGGIFVKLRFQ
ncbi:MAG: YihY/virulence factor BrkB family protein [Anaerolineales bacterium]|nr:YihY/virulence factor BrkB family protein [Anaerolineales bacterium]